MALLSTTFQSQIAIVGGVAHFEERKDFTSCSQVLMGIEPMCSETFYSNFVSAASWKETKKSG